MSERQGLGWAVESTNNEIGGAVEAALQAGTVNGGVHIGGSSPLPRHEMREVYRTAYRSFANVEAALRQAFYMESEASLRHLKDRALKAMGDLVFLGDEFELFAPEQVRGAFIVARLALAGICVEIGNETEFKPSERMREIVADSLKSVESANANFTKEIRRATN
ncbi:hypothetical protein ACIQBJ_14135 [Kitasatospora sp. NPDC088391]|uniref:hypothetical protein n=1 Tax=Kitasatospora sp. NPDC088391 TaxID=3364074 RepID=UPI00382E1C3A